MTEQAVFFIVGPTATGKSELAADVAETLGAEVVSADAFQIYRGLDLLTAKPGAATMAKAPHHLIGTHSLEEEMNAARFGELARDAIREIHGRGKLALVVGGSGLYIKAITHGLNVAPAPDAKLRAELDKLSLEELQQKLGALDPASAGKVDMKNRRRVSRALEIHLLADSDSDSRRTTLLPRGTLTGSPTVTEGSWRQPADAPGVFVFRAREELHHLIKRRVDQMFDQGVVEEVRAAGKVGPTAAKMIGLREIREHLDGRMPVLAAREKIEAATRQYAKRQLTWFRHQTSFEQLNLSPLTHAEAVKWISQRALRSCVKG